MSKAGADWFMGQIRDKEISLNLDPADGSLQTTTRALNDIYFETRSPCNDVAVWLTGTGRLDDIVISAGALDRVDHKQMAALITQTLQRAESTLRKTLQSMYAGQQRRRKS